jgi:hypothetical protein
LRTSVNSVKWKAMDGVGTSANACVLSENILDCTVRQVVLLRDETVVMTKVSDTYLPSLVGEVDGGNARYGL